jgi:hypothetical protein
LKPRASHPLAIDPFHDCPDIEALKTVIQIAESRPPRRLPEWSAKQAKGAQDDGDGDDNRGDTSLNDEWLDKHASHPIKVLPYSPHRNPFKPWVALRPWLDSSNDADEKLTSEQMERVELLAKLRTLSEQDVLLSRTRVP